MDVREIIQDVSRREPLNPYQIAGLTALLSMPGALPSDAVAAELKDPSTVLTILDRCGEAASPYLVAAQSEDSRLSIFPKYPNDRLGDLVYLTGFEGRRLAIEENLIPVLAEIPNWFDVVQTLTRYALERDDESLADRTDPVMEIVTAYLFAAARQPFDDKARAEAEYSICRLLQDVLRSTKEDILPRYMPHTASWFDFLTEEMFSREINPFERRLIAIMGLRSAAKKLPEGIASHVNRRIERLTGQALDTAIIALDALTPHGVAELEACVDRFEFAGKEEFLRDVVRPLHGYVVYAIEDRRVVCGKVRDGFLEGWEHLQPAIEFLRGVGKEWKAILDTFLRLSDNLPPAVMEAFASIVTELLARLKDPGLERILVDGICRTVHALEEAEKQSSRALVKQVAETFVRSIDYNDDTYESLSYFDALEALGRTLGENGYFLVAQEFVDIIVSRPLRRPQEKRFTIEDDDTGEPLVLAEEEGANEAHVRHVKAIMGIVASSPRIMHRLIPYLVIQLEIGGAAIRDEDLIHYRISSVLRANASVTHFPVRTLIKALPYSLKDIGPLDTLRLTAAGLAKELADRGVKPIGNFLGKLRGDIHWRGSIENFYFSLSILKYVATGIPDQLAEWMPKESMPYLKRGEWCSREEAAGMEQLCARLFRDRGVDISDNDSFMKLVGTNTRKYRDDKNVPEFSRRVVLDMVELLTGLHAKYFFVTDPESSASVEESLDRLERIVTERIHLKEDYLVPDLPDPLPKPTVLTEGSEEYTSELKRLQIEDPETPLIIRAKKAGHAYAQKAVYAEPRFEAFNKDVRLEAIQETLASSISNGPLDTITMDNLGHALRFLDSLVQGLAVNGHSSFYLLQVGSDLRFAGSIGLTYDKVRDLLKVLKKELDDIQLSYRSLFEGPFDGCLDSLTSHTLPRKLRELTTLKTIPDSDFYRNYLKTLYISDLQARDGNLRVLETFIEKVELFLNQRLAESGRRVLTSEEEPTDGQPLYFPDAGDISACKIGQKASLLRFATDTPPYFVITTDQEVLDEDRMIEDAAFRSRLTDAVGRLERSLGKEFGDVRNPALFSVRSGSRLSMPGMMITITNVGINDEIAATLAEHIGPWFAYDSYRRFLQEFGQSAYGVAREEFQDTIDERKRRWGVVRKAEMTGDQMHRLAMDYKACLRRYAPEAVELLDEGRFLDILVRCAVIVLRSYDGEAARKYRQAAGIDGNWKTPAIVQAMVYGNLDYESSGTGVVSYNPFTMELRGDFARANQGTDVVDGKVATIPVYDPYKQTPSLASQMPDCWKQLSSILYRTAEKLHLHVTVEYTIEKGSVYILQIRKNRERRERVPELSHFGYRVIAQGTGVSGTIFRGIMVTDRNQIAPYRHINKAQSIIEAMNEGLPEGEKLDGFIFVVNDPIPEEIMEEVFSLPVQTALVSRLGGRGAHAADIAKSLGKVYVGQVRSIAKFSGKPEKVRFGDLDVIVGGKMIVHGQTGQIALYQERGGALGDRSSHTR